jgi:hypothetical protein
VVNEIFVAPAPPQPDSVSLPAAIQPPEGIGSKAVATVDVRLEWVPVVGSDRVEVAGVMARATAAVAAGTRRPSEGEGGCTTVG